MVTSGHFRRYIRSYVLSLVALLSRSHFPRAILAPVWRQPLVRASDTTHQPRGKDDHVSTGSAQRTRMFALFPRRSMAASSAAVADVSGTRCTSLPSRRLFTPSTLATSYQDHRYLSSHLECLGTRKRNSCHPTDRAKKLEWRRIVHSARERSEGTKTEAEEDHAPNINDGRRRCIVKSGTPCKKR